ncbi:MAG: sigma-70 family RNA polymerase sigma factor [Caldiserica bacterium]|nr:sigma-70 family RNA polymerase sigma factor [Caldisericota bacterium]
MPSSPRGGRTPERVESLRQRFLAGDNAAFEELLGMYMPLLKFVARKYCAERDERDDCLAEAVLGFLRAIRTYDSQRGSLDGYVATVASHRLVDMARRRAGPPIEYTDALDGWGSSLGDPAEAGVIDMVTLADTLSDHERACFERRLRGETLEIIAEGLNVSKASVSNALARANRKLGKALR